MMQSILNFLEALIHIMFYVDATCTVILLILSAVRYIGVIQDGWRALNPTTTEHPLFETMTFLITLFLTAAFIWPAGRFRGTLSFSVFEYILFGYLCVGAVTWSVLSYLFLGAKRIPALHVAGAAVLGVLMICFG